MEPDPPDLPDSLTEVDAIGPEGVSEAAVADLDLSGLVAPVAQLDSSRLERVNLSGARLSGAQLRDCVLVECDLANADLRGARGLRLRLSRCRLTGLLLGDSSLTEIEFDDCRADLAVFAGSELDRVVAAGCNLRGSSWQAARVCRSELRRCDLSDADLSDARFESVEFDGCRLDDVRAAERLRGVTMPWEDVVANAGVFAAACGVRVRAE